jgi:glyoxylase-like metal-dependent hydrolase (beta-lactamase superfamily II)
LGDLVPTASHVTLSYITAFDKRPDATLEQKREYLDYMEKDGWLVVFSHGYHQQAGYLERRGGALSLRPIAV